MREGAAPFVARAKGCTTDAERWAVIRDAWRTYDARGAGEFDWDYDSREVMEALDPYEEGDVA